MFTKAVSSRVSTCVFPQSPTAVVRARAGGLFLKTSGSLLQQSHNYESACPKQALDFAGQYTDGCRALKVSVGYHRNPNARLYAPALESQSSDFQVGNHAMVHHSSGRIQFVKWSTLDRQGKNMPSCKVNSRWTHGRRLTHLAFPIQDLHSSSDCECRAGVRVMDHPGPECLTVLDSLGAAPPRKSVLRLLCKSALSIVHEKLSRIQITPAWIVVLLQRMDMHTQ